MSKFYTGSIDLSKIEKERIVTRDKDGNEFKNGNKFVNVVMWVNDEPDQYGNHASIQQSVSKDEREQGKKIYIANLKEYNAENNSTNNANNAENNTDELPF